MHQRLSNDLSRILIICVLIAGVTACQSGPTKFQADDITVHRLTQKVAHVYLVETPAGNLLVDTGFQSSHDNIASWLDSLQIPAESIRAIVLTHAHADHAGSANHLQHRLNAEPLPVFIGLNDKADYASGRSRSKHARYWFARALESDGNPEDFPPLTATHVIEHNTALSEYLKGPPMPGELIPLPGHTPGSLVLIIGTFALMGDTVMGGVITDRARDPLFLHEEKDGDYKILLNRRIVNPYPHVETYLPGHLRPISRSALLRYTLSAE